MDILNKIKQKAKKIDARIVLPEANLDERVYNACKTLLNKNLCKIVVFGKKEQFDKDFYTPNCQIIEIDKFNRLNEFAEQLFELRKLKGLTLKQAKALVKQPDYFTMMLLKNNLADGAVAGACWTTANTLRPALQIVKTKPNKSIVTGAMLMIKEGKKPLVFGDVSLIENPTAENLAEIAISCAEFYKKVIGQPKVAMLSYSTKGSASSDMVAKVQQAVKLAQNKSKFLIDGEMQADSALNKQTALKKGVTSGVAGSANVLIFPDLNAGNIGYKLVSRLAGYAAIGPIMLNFNKPVNDLSRGCTVQEIINTVLLTKIFI